MNGGPGTRGSCGPDAGDAVTAVEAMAYGMVQGVGFRYRTRQRAEALGVEGSAQNLPDGSVCVTAQGPAAAVAALADSITGIIAGRALQGSGAVAAAIMALLADQTREQ
ncbi:MAG: acylphosphatase, partial [Micrococcaceae bacterium]|nr:acylphosphatase [Micrococcaceae bacterium]